MPPTTLPNFQDPEWNAQRTALQDELGIVAEKLLHHMASPNGVEGTFVFETADGRTLTISVQAGPRARGN